MGLLNAWTQHLQRKAAIRYLELNPRPRPPKGKPLYVVKQRIDANRWQRIVGTTCMLADDDRTGKQMALYLDNVVRPNYKLSRAAKKWWAQAKIDIANDRDPYRA